MPRPLSATEISRFRDRLVEAATRHFAAHGLEGLTLRGLAADLGVSPMTPYRYFADKDAILAAMQARAFERFAAALESAFASARCTTGRAAAVGAAYTRFALREPERYRLIFEVPVKDLRADPVLQAAAARARATMTGYVHELVAADSVRGDAELIGQAVWALMHGAVMLRLSGNFSSTKACDAVIEGGVHALFMGFDVTGCGPDQNPRGSAQRSSGRAPKRRPPQASTKRP